MKMNAPAMSGFCNLILMSIRDGRAGNMVGDEYEIRSTPEKTELVRTDIDGYEKVLLKVEVAA